MGLDWIKHFNIYIKSCFTGVYWMLIIDSHRSHMFIKFDDYCKLNNIIIVNMPVYSSHLLQLLGVGIFLFLKVVYGYQINLFIRAFINHIIKLEFFIVYLVVCDKIFIEKNIKGVFGKTNILFWNSDYIILKLDIYFYIFIFSGSYLIFGYK